MDQLPGILMRDSSDSTHCFCSFVTTVRDPAVNYSLSVEVKTSEEAGARYDADFRSKWDATPSGPV